MKLREFSYPSADGLHHIRAREWSQEGEVRGVVQIAHGLTDHMGRYAYTAEYLTEAGLVVCGGDHLGHGETAVGGIYGYFAPKQGWDCVVRDLWTLRELEGARYPGLPYVLLGHSLGSFLVRDCLIRWPGRVDGGVLSGTGQERAPLIAGAKVLVRTLSALHGPDHVCPGMYRLYTGANNARFRPNRTAADWVCRDEGVVDAFLSDPMCNFIPTVSLIGDMMGGLQAIADRGNLARMDRKTPIYLFSGSEDPVGNMGKGVNRVARMLREVGCQSVTVRLYPGGRHEMLNEINRAQVMGELLGWMEENVL